MADQMRDGIAAPGGVYVRDEDRGRIEAVARCIERRLDEPLDLNRLAGQAQMSRSKFKYTFKAVTGKSVREYRNALREREAAALLRDTDLPVSEIAERLGFASSSSFSGFFKQRTGVAPYAYRLRYAGLRRGTAGER